MTLTEVVIGVVKGNRGGEVLPFLAESIGEAGQAAALAGRRERRNKKFPYPLILMCFRARSTAGKAKHLSL